MPYRKIKFVNDEIYHIVLRKTSGELLFKDIDDYFRGIFSIYEFNTKKPVTIRQRRENRCSFKKRNKIHRGPSSVDFVDERDKLVEVLAFCLMPNHIHLLVRQLKSEGITKFMSKIGTGFGGYFNRKYQTKGHVFQDRFNAVHIESETQLKVVFVYIHTNPVAIIEPGWKEKGVQNPEKAIDFVKNYKWSSYFDYMGHKNFPSVTERAFLTDIMGGPEECENFIREWIRHKGELKSFGKVAIE